MNSLILACDHLVHIHTGTGNINAMISSIIGKPTEVKIGAFSPREWDKADWYADISKAQRQLGWQPDTSLEHGLQKCVTPYIENK